MWDQNPKKHKIERPKFAIKSKIQLIKKSILNIYILKKLK